MTVHVPSAKSSLPQWWIKFVLTSQNQAAQNPNLYAPTPDRTPFRKLTLYFCRRRLEVVTGVKENTTEPFLMDIDGAFDCNSGGDIGNERTVRSTASFGDTAFAPRLHNPATEAAKTHGPS
jgi:hypothetical protein